jgi:Sap, sulfolipid-1-addressing protein
MSQAVGEVLAFGIGVALSPVAVIAVVLMLVAPGGRLSATVFVASWATSLGAVATLALLLADGADARQDGGPADWVIAVQASLAILLLIVAARQWRRRGEDGAESELPAWKGFALDEKRLSALHGKRSGHPSRISVEVMT